MTIYKHTLFEGVLNDDYILESSVSKPVWLTYYTFQTEWSNQEHKKEFPDMSEAMRWYRKEFSDRVLEQGKRWIEENDGEYYDISDTPEEYWTDMVYEYKVETN